jgi:very-short-patch-repair endonuclease
LSSELLDWVVGDPQDPTASPIAKDTLPAEQAPHLAARDDGGEPGTDVFLEDHPSLKGRLQDWLDRWTEWSEQERRDAPVRELYADLFSTHIAAAGRLEELELVLGVGCLSWQPAGHDPVQRHLLTCPAAIQFDDTTGTLAVNREQGLDPITVELDMLDPGVIPNPDYINDLKSEAAAFEAHPLDREAVGLLTTRLVHTMDAEGQYADQDDRRPVDAHANVAYAPALILRKRSQQGLVEVFNTIVSQLAEADDVPSGILPLIDPDHQPSAVTDTTPGAVVTIDNEMFLPLPVNDRQRSILEAVDTRAQTVVQGPPGTGKTHTAAALLSHLLAQGKRVLVTAHTDRALYEVRDKLPEAIKPLGVAVVGSSRSDMSDLRVAVERIAAAAAEHNPAASNRAVESALAKIDDLRRARAGTYRLLLDARQQEVDTHQHGSYEGSLAAIARGYQADAHAFTWLGELMDVPSGSLAPLNDREILEWHQSLLDEELQGDETEAAARLVELGTLPDPEAFAALCRAERDAGAAAAAHADLGEHEAFETIRALTPPIRLELQAMMRTITEDAKALQARREAWMNEAVADVSAGRGATWQGRADQVTALITQATPFVQYLGATTQVEADGHLPALAALAQNLRVHLAGGGLIKAAADGTPKLGMMAPRAVKDAALLFEKVRIDGMPPVTERQLALFVTHVEAERVLTALDRAWPATVQIPAEDTLHERLQWHVTEVAQLDRVLTLGRSLAAAERRLNELGVKPPTWTDLETVLTYAHLVDAAAAKDAEALASQPLRALEETLASAAAWNTASPCVHDLHRAAQARDHDWYAPAHQRLTRLHEVRQRCARRDDLSSRLGTVASGVRDAVTADPTEDAWPLRLARFEAAWAWAATGSWILDQDTADVNALQAQITIHEARIRREVETLAATRAWAHAVSPERLTGRAKADLAQYAYLVKRLGKGTGKYAAKQRAEIRQAMHHCREAVPVWIMPIYRIAEQLRVHENMFDVVLVDEASQAGLEASFLQYLAPKIVVIGDDKQVSPVAVGVDQQQLRDLADQYLNHDRYKASWLDPQRSLFDEALMRYGGQITLVEHRRCVPEIIGFSNRIAYEPEGVRLVPVRQYGTDRLDPIKAVHVADGYERGTSNKINPAEVDAIVDQIEKCLADPRYDGLTFGVISLLGGAQAKAIEAKLLERVEPEEWTARNLRCGDAADFQGSERDVMFLSMVAAPEPGRRLGALTRQLYVQRYNVAASRAKDQMWLFHSVTLQELGNPEDMRFALLDYCYGVINRTAVDDDRVLTTAVPDDLRVDPFDSLFEQRVFNRLYDRGFTVIPQYPAEGYNIDLVVIGSKGRLAIECDGDAWHGPEAYERDLARQRDLERCGWQFFRLRESTFYVDQTAALQQLWQTLDELGIYPSGWMSEEMQDDAGDDYTDPGHEQASGLSNKTDMDNVASSPPVKSQPLIAPKNHNAEDQQTHLPAHAASLADLDTYLPNVEAHDIWQGDLGPAMPPEAPATADARMVSAEPPPSVSTLAGRSEEQGEAPVVMPVALDPVLGASSVSTALLEHYQEFQGATTAPVNASRADLMSGLLSIVAVEGPVLGHRLHTAYVKASGGQRVGKSVAQILNSAISAAVRQGTFVVDDPLQESGVKPRTYRLADQPEVRLRTLGPRTLDHVPPRELAELLRQAAADHGWDNDGVCPECR